MKNFFRPEFVTLPKRVVVKVGSESLTLPGGGEDPAKIEKIVSDIHELRNQGLEVILISSGAIASGRRYLPNLDPKVDLATGQALSAIGQIQLMKTYQLHFEKHGIHCGQVLLTHEDFKARARYLNAKNTLQILLRHKAIPILNENDSVSYQEIALGDNDQLAVMVAQMIEADALLILTGPDGLYNKNPDNADAVKFEVINYKDPFPRLSLNKKSGAGRGGMKTKLEAVRKLTPLGIPVILASYKLERPILRAFTQKGAGTYFGGNPVKDHDSRHKGWLMTTVKSGAYIRIDDGALQALEKGASVLASGIVSVGGQFNRGDCISIKHSKKFVGAGLCQYSARELQKIKGLKAQDISAILGHCPSKVVIHRDQLVIKEQL